VRATYRLQLSPDLDFRAVARLVPYLRDLGISHLYLSPSLQARRGSTHGYDVVDPTRVSEDLGGEEGLRALRDKGLEIVLDIVPNHMGVSDENRWWADEDLRVTFFDWDPADGWYRRFFDIDDLAADRPPGRARRPGRVPASPARRGRRARLGREDPASRGAAARLARRGHGRLRVPQRRRRRVRRPGGRGGADGPVRAADR
jgi:hypothetical protein